MKNLQPALRYLVAFPALLTLVTTAQAASIDWGAATNIASSTDVSTQGTLIEAFNATSATSGSLTVNGVQFDNAVVFGNGFVSANLSEIDNGGNYGNLLDSLNYAGNGVTASPTVGGGNLLEGSEYLIQVWYSDERNSGRTIVFGDDETSPSTVTLAQNPGQYVIGTFTADADGVNQTLTITPGAAAYGAHLTAYQLRAIPEPSATGMVAVIGAFVLLRRSRRNVR